MIINRIPTGAGFFKLILLLKETNTEKRILAVCRYRHAYEILKVVST